MADTNKCAHPVCKCTVPKDGAYGTYCREHCQEVKDVSEIRCACRHPPCN
jgi:hypothetical protein